MTRRAERVAKRLSEPPESRSNVSSPIDEEIAALLESVSSKHEGQAAIMDASVPDRVVARRGLPATVRPEMPRSRRPPRRTPPVPRPHQPAEVVIQALSGIAVELPRLELPRPFLSYTVKQAFFLIAIVLLSIAVGILVVYLVPS